MTDYRVPSLASFDWQQPVADRVTAPVGGESQGYRYLVIATASGDFTGQENKIATAKQNNPSDPSHWIFDTPIEGWITWVKDEDLFYVYGGSNWGILYQNLKTTASPTFAGITIANGGTIGQGAGPLLTFDDSGDILGITGAKVGVGTVVPEAVLQIHGAGIGTKGLLRLFDPYTPDGDNNRGEHIGFGDTGESFRGWIGYYDNAGEGSGTRMNIRSKGGLLLSGDASLAGNHIFIDTSGLIGIHTLTPDRDFEIVADANDVTFVVKNVDETNEGFDVEFDVSGNTGVRVNNTSNVTRVLLKSDGTPSEFEDGITIGGSVPAIITLRENNHATNYDFTVSSFTTDGTWRDKDLSSILPAGTTKFWCRVAVSDDLITPIFGLRKNGNTGVSDTHYVKVFASAGGTNYEDLGPIGVDANRVCEYFATNTTWTEINMVITAYST